MPRASCAHARLRYATCLLRATTPPQTLRHSDCTSAAGCHHGAPHRMRPTMWGRGCGAMCCSYRVGRQHGVPPSHSPHAGHHSTSRPAQRHHPPCVRSQHDSGAPDNGGRAHAGVMPQSGAHTRRRAPPGAGASAGHASWASRGAANMICGVCTPPPPPRRINNCHVRGYRRYATHDNHR